jgi:hypothetical protein
MKAFKIILFLLVLLVIALVILQMILIRHEEVPLENISGFSSVKAPQISSLAVSSSVKTAPDSIPTGTEKRISLISRSEETNVPWVSTTPAAKRVRKIFPDTSWMTPDPVLKAGDVITLSLFDDAVFDAKIGNVTRYVNGAIGMTARLAGETHGTVYLSYSGKQMRASIEVPGGADYYCRYDPATGSHYAIEVDPERTVTRPCGGDLLAPSARLEQAVGAMESRVASVPVAQADTLSSATIIYVMIVYTPAALVREGNSVENMNLNIAAAMQRANEAHVNSDTQIELRLIYSDKVDYTESGNDNTDLNRLTNQNDGFMDEVHEWRDAYGADLVCLFSETATVGGLGWLLMDWFGDDTDAFCLAHARQTAWTYTLVHEWGHNMGCGHSKTQEIQRGPGLFSYSAGWQWRDTASARGGYCSVMTYEDADDDGTLDYNRVGYFSNPDIFYTGNSTHPTGDRQDGDNARTLRETRNVIASYRTSSVETLTLPSYNDFEETLGYWVPDEGSTPWFRNLGNDPGLSIASIYESSGTTQAHSDDFFLMFDAYDEEGGTAFLDSTFDFSGYHGVSLKFWYHMECSSPADASDLTVQVSTDFASTWTDLWSGSIGDGWREATVGLSAYAGMMNVQLRFRADIGSEGLAAYILLDDITLMETTENEIDVDTDGLPNQWETDYFGGETNANPAEIAANGVNTVMEAYIAGINPTDPEALFRTSWTNEPGFVVQWNGASGRVYSVWGTTNLSGGFLPLETNILWPQNRWTDTVDRAGGYYRVDVELE